MQKRFAAILLPLLAAGPAATGQPVVICLKPQSDALAYPSGRTAVAALKRQAKASQEPFVKWLVARGATPSRRFWAVNAVAADVPAGCRPQLERHPSVARVFDDALSRSAASAGSSAGAADAWNLVMTGAAGATAAAGRGVTVAVLDTGVAPGVVKASAWFDAAGGRARSYDDSGHGTAVASIVRAVAPGARLVAAKALDARERARLSWLLAASEWVVDPDGDGDTRDAPGVLNASWSPGRWSAAFAPVLRLWTRCGVWPVFSAGNGGPSPGSVSAAGAGPFALSIAAVDRGGEPAEFSGRGPGPDGARKPDLAAPGVQVPALARNGRTAVFSGTSYAAPHVSGALAVLRADRPSLTFEEAGRLLRETARDLGPPGWDAATGWGCVDLAAARRQNEARKERKP
jgi:subtilisin family serine protease